MKSIINLIDKLSLRDKLVVTYFILIAITVFLFGWRLYDVSADLISDIASKNVYELVKKNNEIIDVKLSQVMNNVSAFISDKDLITTYSKVNTKDEYNILLADYKITNILNKYFLQSQDIYSAQLATSYFIYGPRALTMTTIKSLIPKEGFIESEVNKLTKERNGKITWIPTYNFGEMYDEEYLDNIDVDYKYMFSLAVEVKGRYYENGVFSSLSNDIEKPVLVLNFKEDFFQKIHKNSIPVENSSFFVVTEKRKIVSHKDESLLGKSFDGHWIDDVIAKKNGTDLIEIDGKKMIVCYNESDVTKWISVAVFPADKLLESIIPVIRNYTIVVAVILTIISIIVAYFVSMKITNPLNNLVKAIKSTGEGNFNMKIKEEGSIESRELIHRYNVMNEKIQKLIKENYEIKIKEKEAEITALNLQLDPHFMYNTLNLISLISMENGHDEISDMLISMSVMLKYSVKKRDSLVSFREDIEYLKSYIFIMTKRFEGKFIVEYNIEDELYNHRVPKFLLQPLVENSLIHGFNKLNKVGKLEIVCWIEKGLRYFCVKDNGKGIDEEKLSKIISKDSESIGISNINNRVKIIYGNEYGIHIKSYIDIGTMATIIMPLDKI